MDLLFNFLKESDFRDETLLQMGIRGLGCVLRDYTPNRLFPAFGFGARLPPLAEESDEFNLVRNNQIFSYNYIYV